MEEIARRMRRIKVFVLLCCGITCMLLLSNNVFAALQSNNWVWPTSVHTLKNDWPNYSDGSYHGGTDFPVPLNTNVYSSCEGDVVSVKYLTDSYGKHIKIKAKVNGEIVYIRYCHLNEILVNEGQHVAAGQLIGKSGSTGNSTGPHLHYEVRNSADSYSNALNPRLYLPGTSYTFESQEYDNEYYNSYGFDNPSNNEVITEGTFLFQGWVNAKKTISSITCSVNHGEKYVEASLYTRSDVPDATAFRAEIDSNILNIGDNDVALCVNFTDGTGVVAENRTVTWSPKLLWGFDSPGDGLQISDNTFQFSGWIETPRKLERITCSLNQGEQYLTANLYTRPDVPNAIAFRLDIGTANLHYGDNYVSVCAHYADGTGETIAMHQVRKCINDAIESPQNEEKFTCKDPWFLLQGWSTDDNREIDHFEFSINGNNYTTYAHTRSDLLGNARYYREEVPLNRLQNGKNAIEIFALYTDGTSRCIGQLDVFGDLDHTWDEGQITQEATCTENGKRTYTCTNCQTTKTEEIPATGHQHTELRNVKEATDTEDGYTGDTYCTDCGAKLSSGKKIDKLVSTIDQGACGTNIKWQLNSKGVLTISGTGAMKNYTYKSEMPWHKYINDIQSVVIEDGVTSIGDYAFYGMLKLTTVSIPEGVKTIGEYVFKNCTALDGVNLPSTLTKLGQSAFYGCTSLSSIAIPEGLYTVWGYTFKNCTSLEEVTLPSTLIKIDEAAFYGCSSLKKIDIPDNVSIIGIYCFKNCSSLSEVSLPKKLTQIREAVLYGTAIKTLEIPEGVTTVGPYAFKNCTSLKTIELPQSLKKIDEAAFYACDHLSVLNVPENVETIGNYAFRSCEELQSVSFPESLRTIGESSFYGCSSLSELVIPEGVTSLGGYAFKSCVNIYEVTLPTTLETIGESAFYGCSRISSITIPENVAKIGAYAFSRCSGLAEVIFTGNAPSIGDYAFARVTADAIYPGNNSTWTKEKLQDYGGKLTWISDEGKSIAEETMETEETIAETVETENDTVYETEVPETVQEETTEERQQTEETVLETEQETDVTEIEEVVTESIDE